MSLRTLLVGLALCLAVGASGVSAQPTDLPAPPPPATVGGAQAGSESVVTVTTALSQERVRPGESVRASLLIQLEPGWHVNAHRARSSFLIPTTVTFQPHPFIWVRSIQYPKPIRRRFQFSKQALDVYEDRLPIHIDAVMARNVALSGTVSLSGTLSLQACDASVCLAPAEIPLSIPIALVSAEESDAAEPSVVAQEGWLGDLVRRHGVWVWFVATFLSGLALNLTPCVFPMIPVTVAFFSGQAQGRVGYATWLGGWYVFGMALMYAVLGMAAARTGALLGAWLQQPLVLVALAAVMIALALSMFGLYELRPPRWVANRLGQAKAGSVGAFVMGLTVGLIAAPCIGPFVLGLLVLVSQLANPWLGFGLLLTMGLGLGLPYVFVGTLVTRMARWPKAGAWLVWVKRALGVVLVGVALYFLKPLVPAVMPTTTVRAIGGPAARGPAWESYSPQRLEQAMREGRPALVDIYADWCLPCVEMDHVTFRHPEVVRALEPFATLRVDATQRIPPNAEELLDRYGVFGVPTILVFDAKGRERPDLRVTGFIPPAELLKRLADARAP